MSAVMGIAVFVVAADTDAQPPDHRTPVPGEHRLWGELIVRAPVAREHLRVLTDQVDQIWAPYAVTLAWREGPPTSPVPDGFSGWIRVLIDRNATDHLDAGTRRHHAIAALHMPDGVPRDVIYVSLDGARALLRRGNVRMLPPAVQDRLVARIAGRAVAHELGHYLLQTTDHAAEGLMRAEFTPADLLDSGVTRFRLTPVEAARLAERLLVERQAIVARSRPAGGR